MKIASLDELLEDNGATTAEQNSQPVHTEMEQQTPLDVEQEMATEASQARDERGRFAQKQAEAATGDKSTGEPPSSEPKQVEEDDPKIKAFRVKADDEKRKRQDLEKQREDDRRRWDEERATLLRQFSGGQPNPQQQPQKQVPKPQDFLDPEAVHFLQAHSADIGKQLGTVLHRTKVEQSQWFMRQQHEDYDQAEEAFAEAAKANPRLWAEMDSHPMPAAYAYDIGKKVRQMAEIASDPSAYEARIREKVMAELAAQNAGQQTPASQSASKTHAPASPPPTSLASVTSSTPRSTKAMPWTGPTPLDEILK